MERCPKIRVQVSYLFSKSNENRIIWSPFFRFCKFRFFVYETGPDSAGYYDKSYRQNLPYFSLFR